MANMGSISADILLDPRPTDSITELHFSPQTNHILASSWDHKLHIYDITFKRNTTLFASSHIMDLDLSAPVLSCDWSKDGTHVLGSTTGGKAFLTDLNAPGPGPTTVAQHAAPIKSARFVSVPGAVADIIATGSWDGSVKFWDCRQPEPLASVACDGKVFCMDSKGQLLVAGTSENAVHVMDLANPMAWKDTVGGLMHYQIRAVTCLSGGVGYAVAGTDGRCAFRWLDQEKQSKNFGFKCHRIDLPMTNSTTSMSARGGGAKNVDVYPVNAVSVHPRFSTFSTAGGDGCFAYWDADAKVRTKVFPRVGAQATKKEGNGLAGRIGGRAGGVGGNGGGQAAAGGEMAITATGFNKDGSLFAYAAGYDWSKGFGGSKADREDRVMVHVVGQDCNPRPKAASMQRN